MRNKLLIFVSLLFGFGVSAIGYTQTVVFSLGDDDFFVIPLNKCPLQPDNCAANPICDNAEVEDSGKARVIISADMAGANSIARQDPDDIQSFVHMLTFSDRVDIEGILSGPFRRLESSNNAQSRQRFLNIINAYDLDRQKLVNNFGSNFPTAQSLRDVVKSGSRFEHPINSTNTEANNPAVQHIIERARCGWHNGDKRPLYLNSWGGSTDLAQAIFNAPDIKKVVRLVAYSFFNNGFFSPSGGQNGLSCFGNASRCQVWNYLRSQTDLWWVDYTGGTLPVTECTPSVINSIQNRGALGRSIVDNLANNEDCGDVSDSTYFDRPVPWYKLGDTWMLMYAHNSAELRDNPESTSPQKYGRYYRPNPNRTYWQLFDENVKNRTLIYSDWQTRASVL